MKLKDFRIPLLFLIIGSTIVIIGALFKIMHWPYNNELIMLGGVLEVIAAILVIAQLLRTR